MLFLSFIFVYFSKFSIISIYYGLSVCIFPPNVEALTPNVIVFGSGAFGRIIRYRWDNECGVLTIELMIFFKFYLFIYLWLCWVFFSVRGLSPVAASGGHSSLRCTGLSLSRPLLLRSTGSRRAGSVIVAHGPSCSTACGIFPDQGSNPCPLHWQADSQPLRHQGSPELMIL